MSKLLKGSPLARYHREAIAERRLGSQRECIFCGETRVMALEQNSNPRACAECKRRLEGKMIIDKHHIAGRANSDETIPIPANDHRELSEAQRDWAEETLRNPDGCPLLAGAASIRGSADTIAYLIKTFLAWVAEMLEKLSAYLGEELGPNWWSNTEFDKYSPRKRKHNAKS